MRTTNFGVAELRYEWCGPSGQHGSSIAVCCDF